MLLTRPAKIYSPAVECAFFYESVLILNFFNIAWLFFKLITQVLCTCGLQKRHNLLEKPLKITNYIQYCGGQ